MATATALATAMVTVITMCQCRLLLPPPRRRRWQLLRLQRQPSRQKAGAQPCARRRLQHGESAVVVDGQGQRAALPGTTANSNLSGTTNACRIVMAAAMAAAACHLRHRYLPQPPRRRRRRRQVAATATAIVLYTPSLWPSTLNQRIGQHATQTRHRNQARRQATSLATTVLHNTPPSSRRRC